MRIITGKFKGFKLISPEKKSYIRPTSDRAKETIFNILNNITNFENKIILDLFCGTGSLGIEAISRGADFCTFVDINIDLIRKNINKIGLYTSSEAIKSDSIKYIKIYKEKHFDIIFADPPYNYKDYEILLNNVSIIKSIFILEHSDFKLPEKFKSNLLIQKKIGITYFSILDFVQYEKSNSNISRNV